jgi:hypothetical protein
MVAINATSRGAITVDDNNGMVTVSGLASTVTISNFEANLDQLVINGQSLTVAAVNGNNSGGTATASDGSQAVAASAGSSSQLTGDGLAAIQD